MTLRRNDGKLVPISLNTTLLRNKIGEPIAMVNVARDITDRMRLVDELENKNKQIELINRIITTANQTQDFQEIFRTIANEVSTVVICNGISIAVVLPDGQSLRIYAAQGVTGYRVGDVIESKESPPYRALRNKRAVIVYDMHKDEPSRAVGLTDGSIRSYLSVPIILRGKNFGTLNLGSKEPHAFSDDHINLLQPIGQQIGAIIDRVILFEQVTNDAVYIHNLLDSIDSVVFTIDRELRVSEINHAFRLYMRDYELDDNAQFVGKNLYDIIREDSLKIVLQNIVPSLLNGSIRIFSQEYEHNTTSGLRTYQLIVNPLIINRVVVGLVFMHTDITDIKKTEAELKKSNRQLLALNQISTLISASLEIDELMNAALPLVKNTLDAGAVIVYEHNIENDEITIVSQIGFDTVEFSSVNRLQLSGSATGDVILSQQPMYIGREPYNDERIVRQNRGVLRSLQIEAMAIIPLISKGKVFGALDIFYTTPHDFSPQDRQILSLVGNQLGAALHNLHLYGELRSQIERLTVLYELSQSLTSTLDIDEIFRQVFNHIRRIISCEEFRIDLYSPGTSQLTPIFEAQSSPEGGYRISKGAQSSGLVQGSPEAVVVSSKCSHLSAGKNNLVIPMTLKETIIGIMALRSADSLSFTPQQLTILESIANLVAIAFEKAQLHHETVQKSIEIERRNKELDDFTYVVSHDLKEPLISVEGFSRILQTDYEGVILPEGKEYLDSIVGATTRMKGLIDDLLLLSRISRPMESYTEVNVDKVVGEIRTDMEFTIHKRNVTFSVPEALPDIYCNGTQIKIVFRNLIANAIKFNDKPNPNVEIGFRNAENNCYLFYVRDNGIGIEKEFYGKIFIIFQRLHRREEYEGSGAGLAIVKKIIELHKGKIWVDSEVGLGTTFYFTIPKTRPQES
jgi:signal transduction histidine kinase/PAS domain-containing protein